MKRLCVFCGSSPGNDPLYIEAARSMGALLADRGIGLVYGGGSVGLMGAVADGALEKGGAVIGVIPRFLDDKELGHRGLTEIRVVESMHERKAMMATLSDGFIALPGGFGTFEELCEVITWSQLGLHQKPIGVLDVAGYYKPLLDLFDRGVAEAFIGAPYRKLVMQSESPEELLGLFESYQPPVLPKWISRNAQT